MSLVMSLVMYDKAVIVGDLRATNADKTGEKLNGINKVFSLNETVAFGVTGDLHVMESLNKWLSEQDTEKSNVNAVARLIRKYLRGLSDPDVQLRAHVLGVGDGGKITLIELDYSDGYDMHKIVPGKQSVNWRAMYANVSPLDMISEGFTGLPDYGTRSIAKMLAEVNEEVSRQDDFVSPECTAITIEK